ncbi:MAG: hypothetical protein JWL91_908 [Sphingomonas bacterium]|nr:hypothetical protein [Sphingomonas bacterium]MDB5689032.1 hypothetical protein [Sphingomonas bacterium]
MSTERELMDFARETFSSVWSLETALLMMSKPGHDWQQADLVTVLRASKLVVVQAVDELLAAGLVVVEPGDRVRYQPATPDIGQAMTRAAALYATSPSAVRRVIVRSRRGGISAFSDAFKLRKGEP